MRWFRTFRPFGSLGLLRKDRWKKEDRFARKRDDKKALRQTFRSLDISYRVCSFFIHLPSSFVLRLDLHRFSPSNLLIFSTSILPPFTFEFFLCQRASVCVCGYFCFELFWLSPTKLAAPQHFPSALCAMLYANLCPLLFLRFQDLGPGVAQRYGPIKYRSIRCRVFRIHTKIPQPFKLEET